MQCWFFTRLPCPGDRDGFVLPAATYFVDAGTAPRAGYFFRAKSTQKPRSVTLVSALLRLPCASRPTRRSGTRRLRRLRQPSLFPAPGCDARQGKSRTAVIWVTVSNVGSAATLAPARSAGQSGARAWLSERRSREFQARRIGRASQRTRPAGGRGPGAMVLDTFPLRKVSRRRGRNPASKVHRCRRQHEIV